MTTNQGGFTDYITIFFEKNKNGTYTVTTYITKSSGIAPDSTKNQVSKVKLSGTDIIFNPFSTSYDGSTLKINSVFVYDEVLDENDVAQLDLLYCKG